MKCKRNVVALHYHNTFVAKNGMVRLSVNLNKIALIRNSRGGNLHPILSRSLQTVKLLVRKVLRCTLVLTKDISVLSIFLN